VSEVFAEIGGVRIKFRADREELRSVTARALRYHLIEPGDSVAWTVRLAAGPTDEELLDRHAELQGRAGAGTHTISIHVDHLERYDDDRLFLIYFDRPSIAFTRTLEWTNNKERYFYKVLRKVLFELLCHSQLYLLHASAVSHERWGSCVFMGDQKASKSTLAIALAENGWDILTDDTVTFRITDGASRRVEIGALRRELHLDPKIGRGYDRLRAITRLPEYIPGRTKVAVPIEMVYPHRMIDRLACPSVVVYSQVVDRPTTRIEPLCREAGMAAMRRNSFPGRFDPDGEGRKRHLAALDLLAAEARFFSLECGRDAYEEPNVYYQTVCAAIARTHPTPVRPSPGMARSSATIRDLVRAECSDEHLWKDHIVPTVEAGRMLAKRLDANVEVVELAAWLHDIARLRGRRRDHEKAGAFMAGTILAELGYDAEILAAVQHCIREHRDPGPNATLEARIVASADAMSRLSNITRLFHFAMVARSKPPAQARAWVTDQVARSWKKMMPAAQELARPLYEALQIVLAPGHLGSDHEPGGE